MQVFHFPQPRYGESPLFFSPPKTLHNAAIPGNIEDLGFLRNIEIKEPIWSAPEMLSRVANRVWSYENNIDKAILARLLAQRPGG